MARDKTKRLAVRGLLVQPEWQRRSDRDVAREAEVSKQLVGVVRWEMIAEGLHPPHQPVLNPDSDDPTPVAGAYQEGRVVRGGYVRGPGGQILRDTAFAEIKKQAAKKKLARARAAKRQKGG